MTKHRVNLYTSEFKPVKILLSLNQIATCLTIALFVLLGIISYSSLEQQKIQNQVITLNKQLTKKQEQLKTQESLLATHKPAASLANQVAQFKEVLSIKDALLAELKNQDIEAKQGYSSLLMSLAKTDKGGLWLKHISAKGKRLNLQGVCLNSDAVPAWLMQFKQFPTLADMHFSSMQMWRNEAQDLLFSLSSQEQTEGGENE